MRSTAGKHMLVPAGVFCISCLAGFSKTGWSLADGNLEYIGLADNLTEVEKMSEEAVVAKKGPFGKVVKKGETYWWCACGLSKTQPFCDGSHKDTNFQPVKYVADDNVMVAFCGCKQTKCAPYCDDSHIAIVIEPKESDET